MKRLFAVVFLVVLGGCAGTLQTVGTHSAAVEIAQANAASEKARSDAQIAMMRALIEAVARLTPQQTQMAPLCVDADGITVVPCKAVIR